MNDNNRMLVTVGLSILTVVSIALLLLLGPEYFLLKVLLIVIMIPIILLGAYMMITGKGSSLISGYNTSPKHVKAAYDEVALARFTGLFVWIFCIMILLTIEAFLFFDTIWAGIAAIVITAALLIWFIVHARGKAFKKDPSAPMPVVTEEDRKKNRKTVIIASAATVLIIGVVFVALFSYGNVSADLDDDRLVVKAPMVDETIVYADISVADVSYTEDFSKGTRVGGVGTFKISSGDFKNNQFGVYKLASYNDVNAYIVIKKADGNHLVFNLESAEKTRQFHQDLIDILNRQTP